MKLSQFFFTIPPLFFATCIYMLGLCAEQTKQHQIIFLLLFTCCATATYLLHKNKSSKKLIAVPLLLFLFYPLGALLLYTQKEHYQTFYEQIDSQLLDISGTITDISYIDHHLYSAVITLNNIAIDGKKLHKKIQIYTVMPENIQIADTVELHNIKIKKASSESYQQYLLKEGIITTIFITKPIIELLDRPTYSINRWIDNKRQDIYERLQKKISSAGFSAFGPIFLGKKNIRKKENMWINTALFTTWGITHYLARSGLHLVVLIALWLTIFNFLPLSFNNKQWFLLTISIIYFLFSWSSIPFYRALATLIFHRVCLLARLQSHFLHLLIVTCFLILLHNPIQLFFLDFQLSFGLTFALACFSHINGYKKTENNQTLAMPLKNILG